MLILIMWLLMFFVQFSIFFCSTFCSNVLFYPPKCSFFILFCSTFVFCPVLCAIFLVIIFSKFVLLWKSNFFPKIFSEIFFQNFFIHNFYKNNSKTLHIPTVLSNKYERRYYLKKWCEIFLLYFCFLSFFKPQKLPSNEGGCFFTWLWLFMVTYLELFAY